MGGWHTADRPSSFWVRAGYAAAALRVLPFVLVGSCAVADLVHPDKFWLLSLVVAPFLGAVVLRVRVLAALALISCVLGVFLPQAFWTDGGMNYVRLSAIVGLSALAVTAASWREARGVAARALAAERRSTEQARRAVLEMNDTILQDMVAAEVWLSMGDSEAAERALTTALNATRDLVADLLGDRGIRPGDLVRVESETSEPGPSPRSR